MANQQSGSAAIPPINKSPLPRIQRPQEFPGDEIEKSDLLYLLEPEQHAEFPSNSDSVGACISVCVNFHANQVTP